MRIRKCASRILGSAASAYNPPSPPRLPPPPPPAAQLRAPSSALPAPPREMKQLQAPAAAAASAAVPLVMNCVVNRSPWDVMTPDDYFQYFVGGDAEEEKKTIIPVDKMKVGIGSSSVAAAVRMKKEKKKKFNPEKKSNIKEEIVDPSTKTKKDTKLCNKNDGKGWHCKQQALIPHTLCSYHLNQVRSYAGNRAAALARAAAAAAVDPSAAASVAAADLSAAPAPAVVAQSAGMPSGAANGAQRQNKKQKRSAAPASAAAVVDQPAGNSAVAAKDQAKKQKRSMVVEGGDDVYIYYAGFGPWNSKSRTEEAGDKATPVTEPVGAGVGKDKENVAGVDLEKNKKNATDQAKKEEEEAKKNGRKRGRKPVKARSLKSLL